VNGRNNIVGGIEARERVTFDAVQRVKDAPRGSIFDALDRIKSDSFACLDDVEEHL